MCVSMWVYMLRSVYHLIRMPGKLLFLNRDNSHY